MTDENIKQEAERRYPEGRHGSLVDEWNELQNNRKRFTEGAEFIKEYQMEKDKLVSVMSNVVDHANDLIQAVSKGATKLTPEYIAVQIQNIKDQCGLLHEYPYPYNK